MHLWKEGKPSGFTIGAIERDELGIDSNLRRGSSLNIPDRVLRAIVLDLGLQVTPEEP